MQQGRGRRVTFEEAFARMDGRTVAFLVRELKERKGIGMSPSCISNYRKKIRLPSEEILRAIVEVLSPREAARRVAEKVGEARANNSERDTAEARREPHEHQVP
jgi:hypothetical protein